MLPGTGQLGNSRVLTVEAQRLEFVVNNGSNDWWAPACRLLCRQLCWLLPAMSCGLTGCGKHLQKGRSA